MTTFIHFLDIAPKLGDMEKRTAHRKRVFKAGMIEFPGGAFSCVVRNLSDTGANLDVPSVIGIPHEFTLSIPTAQFRFSCRAVWRSDRRIGVAFA
ncbi:PilZ domain-containing protein [Bradyrhizobium sp. DASA03120]|uniref:PilZ domain-containing protein n=1 Tax=Bradyrhizobium sp. SMVTL-02 TaxID=3395917 RepID=UPI003F6E5CA9